MGDDNLLSNSSFEEEGTGVPALGWTYYQCGYSRSNTVSKDGSWSCKIAGTGGAGEVGLGGSYQAVSTGLPESERFTASSNIYISSYSQGEIYGIYVTVNYTDSSQDTFNYALSAAEINANLNSWKKYSRTFTTDPAKTISSIYCWCLVWTGSGNKFIGTVYFDDVKLEICKAFLYWPGNKVYGATNPVQAASDVINRGFTHAIANQYDSTGAVALFLNNSGFSVVKNIGATKWNLDFTPRYCSPYNDKQSYDTKKQNLISLLSSYSYISGIVDDIEELPFPAVSYSVDGVASVHTFSDLEERIGNQPSQSSGWPVFKDWPAVGDHDVSNLNIENIEYNFPNLSLDITGTPSASSIIGYYGSGFSYESYEMVAQTFKPVDSRIARIDVMVRRYGTAFPLGNLYYYLTEVDANGKPDLSRKISYSTCTIQSSETDCPSSQTWDGIEPLPLYFDPVEVGELDTNKQYALVLEFTKKDNNDWNGAFYYAAGFDSDVYGNGQAWRRCNGAWTSFSSLYDMWIKVYEPNPPAGFALNQFHEDWIDFQCAVMARYVQDYRTIADSVTPARQVWIYSGYAGIKYGKNLHNYDGDNKRAYSADWEKFSAAGIDYAICGYGTKSITDTVNALNAGNSSNPPKLIGGGYTPYGETSFIDRCNNCDGAMLYYIGDYVNDPGWSIP
jgi:hypothetical protein